MHMLDQVHVHLQVSLSNPTAAIDLHSIALHDISHKTSNWHLSVSSIGSMGAPQDTFRDADKEMGFKIAALKTHIWPEVLKNNTPERATELQEMFLSGHLDTKLIHACKVLDPEFKPSHITWVNKPNTDIAYDLSAALRAGEQCDSLHDEALRVNLELFMFELKKEQTNFTKFKVLDLVSKSCRVQACKVWLDYF